MSTDTKNRSQFLDIYRKHSDELFRYAFFKTGNREVSLEIVQEVFMKIWNAFRKNEHPDNIKAFLYTAVRNAVTDWYRKKKPVSLDELQEAGFDAEAERESYADKFDVEKILEKANDLDEMYREIIILRFVNDLSVKEIAKLLNERENNISVRIHRAVDKLTRRPITNKNNMKEKWFDNLIREAKQTKLTASEKQNMLSAILGDARMPSPYFFALTDFIRTYHRQAVAFAMVFIVIVTTGGTSFAAEKALPGDTLYSIKVNVNEEIQSFVALSPVAKARVGIERATKRLKEAEQLAVEGRLTPEVQDIIKDKIKEHGEEIKANLDVLAVSDEAAAKEVVSDFKASVEAVVPSAPVVAIASAPMAEEVSMQAKMTAEPEVALFATTMVAEDASVETSPAAFPETASTTTDIVPELDAQAIGLLSIAEEIKAEITTIEQTLATSSPDTVIEVQ